MKKDYVFYMKSKDLTNKQAASLMSKGYTLTKQLGSKKRVVIGIEEKGDTK